MSPTCTPNTVDEHAVRIVAALVVVIALTSALTGSVIPLAFLFFDFGLRAWVDRRYSPLRLSAKAITSAFGVAPKPIYAPPKRFAARVGFVFAASALLLAALGAGAAATVVTLALVGAASLEALMGFCVACWIYPHLPRIGSAH